MTQFDFWYTGVAEDDTEVAWAGGYKISPLEAKTDLSDYVEKESRQRTNYQRLIY